MSPAVLCLNFKRCPSLFVCVCSDALHDKQLGNNWLYLRALIRHPAECESHYRKDADMFGQRASSEQMGLCTLLRIQLLSLNSHFSATQINKTHQNGAEFGKREDVCKLTCKDIDKALKANVAITACITTMGRCYMKV